MFGSCATPPAGIGTCHPSHRPRWSDLTLRNRPDKLESHMTDSPTRAPLSYGAELLGRVLAGTPASESPLTHVAELPAEQFRAVGQRGASRGICHVGFEFIRTIPQCQVRPPGAM